AHVWDLATGREIRQVRLPGSAAHVALAANGLVFASSSGGPVRLWDTATGKESGKIDTAGRGVAALALSPDGKLVATRGQEGAEVYLWDRVTGRPLHTLTGTAPDQGAGAQQVIVTTDVAGVL